MQYKKRYTICMQIYSYQTRTEPQRKKRRFRFRIPPLKRWNWKKIFLYAFRLCAAGIFIAALLFLYYSKDLPDPNKLLTRSVPESTKIYARDNTTLLYEIHGEAKRTQVGLDQISDNLKHATVAVEDKDFYHHGGISVTGIIRAVLVDIVSGQKAQGGSTITQQFVKKAILSDDKAWSRKIKEVILAVMIDARFSKDDILKLYLNEIPYGRNAYGIEAASQSYFGKSAKDLDLAESAYLAAMPQAPTYYNPTGPHRDALDARKNTILQLMKDQGYITEDQRKEAADEKVAFTTITNSITAPHFVMYVQDYLAQKYGETTLEEGGLKVYTTLDPRLQQIAEQAVKDGADQNAKKYKANNAALVAIDPKTGQILAMVGSKDYFGDPEPAGCIPGKSCTFEPNFNVAISDRQPGSSFKPYVYVTAFKPEFKYAPASMLFDVVTNFGTFGGKSYIPHNYSGEENGPVSMRTALAGSLNIPAVKTLDLVGVDNAVQTARDLGITSPLSDCGLSLVLGGCDVKLLDHVASYAALANGGIRNDKTPILKIEDRDGKTLEEYQPNPKPAVDPQADYELISIMTDNNARSFVFGSKSPLILPDRTVAAKTGTTQEWGDGWTVGFTPSLAAGVWAGNNDNEKMKTGADGVYVAAPIWHNFMEQALKGTSAEDFPVPDGIQKVTVDAVSGKLPTPYTPSTKTETFAGYSVPTDYDNVHVAVNIDTQTGQPATSLTPPSQISTQLYTIFHSEKPDNPNWEDPVEAWSIAHGYSYAPPGSATETPPNTGPGPRVSITEPSDNAVISQNPFTVTVAAESGYGIARVDLSVDGSLVQSLNSSPFVFHIGKTYANGKHTIAAKAVDGQGQTSDTSVDVTFAQAGAPIAISDPADGSQADFPLIISAESPNLYDQVQFFYQTDQGTAQFLGNSVNTDHVGGNYQYQMTWNNKPAPGSYRIYAVTNSGIVSPKIKVTVP